MGWWQAGKTEVYPNARSLLLRISKGKRRLVVTNGRMDIPDKSQSSLGEVETEGGRCHWTRLRILLGKAKVIIESSSPWRRGLGATVVVGIIG